MKDSRTFTNEFVTQFSEVYCKQLNLLKLNAIYILRSRANLQHMEGFVICKICRYTCIPSYHCKNTNNFVTNCVQIFKKLGSRKSNRAELKTFTPESSTSRYSATSKLNCSSTLKLHE